MVSADRKVTIILVKIMKIGQYTFGEWLDDCYISDRYVDIGNCLTYFGVYFAYDFYAKNWQLYFGSKVRWLEQLYSGTYTFGELANGKEVIDNFLTKISQLKAFW